MSGKTTGKTTRKIPQPHGGALNSGGTRGNKGGGRPSDAFKDFLAEQRRDPKARKAFTRAMRNASGRNFTSAWKIAADYDDDKPAEKHAIVGPIEVRVRIEREGRRVTAS